MIVIKVCMWPHGMASQEYEIARATITNVGGTDLHGDYHVRVSQGQRTFMGTVIGYPRGPRNLWPLIKRALSAVRPQIRGSRPEPRSHGALDDR